jgi:hypothetical protein
MSGNSRFAFFILLVALLLAGRAEPVAACTCAINPSPAAEFDQAAAVFAGRVVRIDLREGPGAPPYSPVRVILEVETVWKGPLRSTIEVFTAVDEGACGFNFNVGWRYLVYARASGDALQASSCTRTAVLSHAGEDLAALEEGIQVIDGWRSGRTQAVLLLGLVAATLLLWVVRKVRREKVSRLRELLKD